MYCQEDEGHSSAGFQNTSIVFEDSSQEFLYNFFSENGSIQSNIDKIFSYADDPDGCTLAFQYKAFAFNGSGAIIEYLQDGTSAYFTCFYRVKYSNEGLFRFERNNVTCERFEDPRTVRFRIVDLVTR